MTPIAIRTATERDLDALVQLNRVVHDLHVAAVPTFFQQPSVDAAIELCRSKLQRSDLLVWIAEMEGMPVGYATVVLRERPENAILLPRRFLELDEIAVSPTHRRKGVARALVERAIEEASLRGVPDVELSAWSFNADANATFRSARLPPDDRALSTQRLRTTAAGAGGVEHAERQDCEGDERAIQSPLCLDVAARRCN